MRIFINGFGRIGRSVLRAFLQSPDRWPGLEVVGVNDIAAPDMCAEIPLASVAAEMTTPRRLNPRLSFPRARSACF